MSIASTDEQPNFETALEKLEAAVDRLEQGDLPLEDALRTFEDGVRWSRACHQLLDRAEQRPYYPEPSIWLHWK